MEPAINIHYRDDLEIDKYDLPGEWEKQPALYAKWADEWAYAVQLRDQAKDALDLVKADLDASVRADPGAYGITKITEAVVAGAVIKSAQYEEAIEALHQANLNVNILAGAKAGMDTKRRALENLTTLLVNEFYQSAGVPAQASVAAGKAKQDKQKRKLSK